MDDPRQLGSPFLPTRRTGRTDTDMPNYLTHSYYLESFVQMLPTNSFSVVELLQGGDEIVRFLINVNQRSGVILLLAVYKAREKLADSVYLPHFHKLYHTIKTQTRITA